MSSYICVFISQLEQQRIGCLACPEISQRLSCAHPDRPVAIPEGQNEFNNRPFVSNLAQRPCGPQPYDAVLVIQCGCERIHLCSPDPRERVGSTPADILIPVG